MKLHEWSFICALKKSSLEVDNEEFLLRNDLLDSIHIILHWNDYIPKYFTSSIFQKKLPNKYFSSCYEKSFRFLLSLSYITESDSLYAFRIEYTLTLFEIFNITIWSFGRCFSENSSPLKIIYFEIDWSYFVYILNIRKKN